jgi:hypothetical protein
MSHKRWHHDIGNIVEVAILAAIVVVAIRFSMKRG